MFRVKLTLLLILLSSATASASPQLTLPDTSVYYYWFRSMGGIVEHAPKSTGSSGVIDLSGHTSGGTVFVLDPHTGGIAQIPVASASKGAAVTVDQFTVPSANSSATASASSPTPITPATSTATGPAVPPTPSLLSRVVSWLIGLAVLAGVVWFVRSLVLTKGQLLIDTARKVGVEVPNPDDLPPTNVEREGKYEPPPIIRVQRVPEEAVKPLAKPSTAGYLTSENGTSYGIGERAMTIGRGDENDIVLADGSVSRKHARIESTNGSAAIFDEDSANGVFINGQRIASQLLSPGDQVLIGRVPLRYEK